MIFYGDLSFITKPLKSPHQWQNGLAWLYFQVTQKFCSYKKRFSFSFRLFNILSDNRGGKISLQINTYSIPQAFLSK